jgi:general secretion pathway protein J
VNARGFSLLEALVTLVILSMIATVMMQSLSQVLDLRERVLRSERDARVAALEERWFRESIGAAVADLPGAAGAFQGDSRSMRFLGLDPLDGSGLAVVEWRIEATPAGARLELRQGDRAWPLRGGFGAATGFRYLDAAGRWQSRWPPAAEPGAAPADAAIAGPNVREVLPQAVAIGLGEALEPEGPVWVADIGASAGLPLPLRVRLEGLDGSTL